MNTKIKLLSAIVFATGLLIAVSCKGKTEASTEAGAETEIQQTESTTQKTETDEKQGKEYTAAYVCPMHCEGSGSDQEGNCPKCGMAYVANAEHSKDGHTH